MVGDIYTKQEGIEYDSPKKVRLLAMQPNLGNFVVTDAETFAASFAISPTDFANVYGGNPNFPESELDLLKNQVASQNAQALRALGHSEGVAERDPNAGPTPEEIFAKAAKKK